jgi:transposase
MLSIKEIADKFDISKSTLYDWKRDRPVIYDYLASADEKYEKYREVNIFLETYIKTADTKIFDFKEIEYIFDLELHPKTVPEMQNIELTYINTSAKITKENTKFTLNIYKKLEALNLIEKYIFCNILSLLPPKVKAKKEEKKELLTHYFKEFLV